MIRIETKEVIHGKIFGLNTGLELANLLSELKDKDAINEGIEKIQNLIDRLFSRLEQAKSIEDLQREAFEAGRKGEFITDDYFEYAYPDFEDYLKIEENE